MPASVNNQYQLKQLNYTKYYKKQFWMKIKDH